MGTGIALVANRVAGKEVTIVDNSQKQLDASKKFIEKWCDKEIKKERLTAPEKDLIFKRTKFSQSLKDLGDSDFIIEAVTENFDVKEKIFAELDKVAHKDAILASNTSSISVTKIAGTLPEARADKVIGMHFFNPVPVMKLVEVIHAIQAS